MQMKGVHVHVHAHAHAHAHLARVERRRVAARRFSLDVRPAHLRAHRLMHRHRHRHRHGHGHMSMHTHMYMHMHMHANDASPAMQERAATEGWEGNELTNFNQDILVLANPEIANLPGWVIGLVAAGGLAAALSTAAGLLLAIPSAVSHDLINGQWNPRTS